MTKATNQDNRGWIKTTSKIDEWLKQDLILFFHQLCSNTMPEPKRQGDSLSYSCESGLALLCRGYEYSERAIKMSEQSVQPKVHETDNRLPVMH